MPELALWEEGRKEKGVDGAKARAWVYGSKDSVPVRDSLERGFLKNREPRLDGWGGPAYAGLLFRQCGLVLVEYGR